MAGTDTIIDVDRDTGELIQGWPRCRKSIETILRTRLHTRLMRLWWGSEFLNALDKPANEQTFVQSIMAAITAINKYEPEFKVSRVILDGAIFDGTVMVTVEGVYLPEQSDRKATVTF